MQRIATIVGKTFIQRHHYSRSIHNGPIYYGLLNTYKRLLGVCAFANPCSEHVRSSIFGAIGKDWVFELHCLCILDGSPKNTASWFITRAIRLLQAEKAALRVLLSFADATEGHCGYVYQEINALYCGMTEEVWFYWDGEGRLRHPRQHGVNISLAHSAEMGWTPERRAAKHRYLLLLDPPPGTHTNKRRWKAQARRLFTPECEWLLEHTYPKQG